MVRALAGSAATIIVQGFDFRYNQALTSQKYFRLIAFSEIITTHPSGFRYGNLDKLFTFTFTLGNEVRVLPEPSTASQFGLGLLGLLAVGGGAGARLRARRRE